MKEVLRGEAYWANVRKPNNLSGKLQMDLGNMDKPSMKLVKQAGIKLKNKGDEKGDFITLKGSPEYPPRVIDSQGNVLPEPVTIGNGSKVKVPFNTYDWKFNGQEGTNVGLNTVMVIKMVEYVTDQMDKEEGYVAPVQQDMGHIELEAEDDPF